MIERKEVYDAARKIFEESQRDFRMFAAMMPGGAKKENDRFEILKEIFITAFVTGAGWGIGVAGPASEREERAK